MDSKYESLFTPWKIKNCEIKNRIVMTSMGGTSIFGWMEPNHFDKEAANFLLERAKNNVGLILPGIAPIRDILLGKWLYQGKGKFKKLKEFMDEFHKTGAKMFVQLTAGFGRSLAINDIMVKALHNKALATVLKPALDVSYLTASASATPNRWQESCISRPLTQKEIHEMVEAFAKTAKLCMDAGVDGVEIHAVHEGYLLDQFTMKYTNQRTDEYGGSFENRYRFPVEIVKAIKKACGDDFPVSLRYSVVSKTKDSAKARFPAKTTLRSAAIWKKAKEPQNISKTPATICSTATTAPTTPGTGLTPVPICRKTATSKTSLTLKNSLTFPSCAQAVWNPTLARKQSPKAKSTVWALLVSSLPIPHG